MHTISSQNRVLIKINGNGFKVCFDLELKTFDDFRALEKSHKFTHLSIKRMGKQHLLIKKYWLSLDCHYRDNFYHISSPLEFGKKFN